MIIEYSFVRWYSAQSNGQMSKLKYILKSYSPFDIYEWEFNNCFIRLISNEVITLSVIMICRTFGSKRKNPQPDMHFTSQRIYFKILNLTFTSARSMWNCRLRVLWECFMYYFCRLDSYSFATCFNSLKRISILDPYSLRPFSNHLDFTRYSRLVQLMNWSCQ